MYRYFVYFDIYAREGRSVGTGNCEIHRYNKIKTYADVEDTSRLIEENKGWDGKYEVTISNWILFED